MRLIISAAFLTLGLMSNGSAVAVPLGITGKPMVEIKSITDVQYSRGGSRQFRRCMRAKYGPRYFSRVPRAHRFFMAQACGG